MCDTHRESLGASEVGDGEAQVVGGGSERVSRRTLLGRSVVGPVAAAVMGAGAVAGCRDKVEDPGQQPQPKPDPSKPLMGYGNVPHQVERCDLDRDLHHTNCYEQFSYNFMEVDCTPELNEAGAQTGYYDCIHEELI